MNYQTKRNKKTQNHEKNTVSQYFYNNPEKYEHEGKASFSHLQQKRLPYLICFCRLAQKWLIIRVKVQTVCPNDNNDLDT